MLLLNFGMFAISDCPFICLFVCLWATLRKTRMDEFLWNFRLKAGRGTRKNLENFTFNPLDTGFLFFYVFVEIHACLQHGKMDERVFMQFWAKVRHATGNTLKHIWMMQLTLTGDAPTTSEWSKILLLAEVKLICLTIDICLLCGKFMTFFKKPKAAGFWTEKQQHQR